MSVQTANVVVSRIKGRKRVSLTLCLFLIFNTLLGTFAMAGAGSQQHHHNQMMHHSHAHDADFEMHHAQAGTDLHDCCEVATSVSCDGMATCAVHCAQFSHIASQNLSVFNNALRIKFSAAHCSRLESTDLSRQFKPPRVQPASQA